MGFESYSVYLSQNQLVSSTPSAYFRNNLQEKANQSFEIASDYYIIKHQDRETKLWDNVGVRLISKYNLQLKNTISDDFFKVLFKDFDYNVKLGDMFEFDNYRWMVIDTANIKSITNSVSVRRCNVKLNFIEASTPVLPYVTSNIISIDGIADNKILDPKEDGYILLPNNQLMIKISSNEYSSKIKYTPQGGTRFIFGNPKKCWKVVAIDDITEVRTPINGSSTYDGIITLRLQSDNINPQIDNIALGIAKQYA